MKKFKNNFGKNNNFGTGEKRKSSEPSDPSESDSLELQERQRRNRERVRYFNERAMSGQRELEGRFAVNIMGARLAAQAQAIAQGNPERYPELLHGMVDDERARASSARAQSNWRRALPIGIMGGSVRTRAANKAKARKNWRKTLPVGIMAGPVHRRATESANNPDRLAELGLFDDPEARARYFEPATSFGKKRSTVIRYLKSLL